MADKAYSSRANRAWLRRHAIKAVISVKQDQKKHRRHRGRAGRRPPVFDPGRYKQRNTVETSKPQYCHSRGLAGTAAGSFLFGVHEGGLIVRPGAAVVLAQRARGAGRAGARLRPDPFGPARDRCEHTVVA
jgi:hypothetical protein